LAGLYPRGTKISPIDIELTERRVKIYASRVVVFGVLATSVLIALAPMVWAASQTVTLAPGDTLAVTCSTTLSGQIQPQQANLACAALPTSTPTSVPTPTATATTVNGVPLCTDHDPTKWHPLVKSDASGNVVCTYGHEHGMNPSTGDSVFGSLALPQQISYAWATVSATGVGENSVPNKHRMYKWLVAPSLPCALNSDPNGQSKMITAFREELHADGNLGAAIRFHSFWGEYQLTNCANGERGYLSVGGHIDYADLYAGNTLVPLGSIDPPSSCVLNGDRRQEGLLGSTEQSSSVWYGASEHATVAGATQPCDDDGGLVPHVSVQVNVDTNQFGPVDPSNPTSILFYPDFPNHDQTIVSTDAQTIWISGFSTDASGHVNFNGWVDRHGRVVSGCLAPSIDCIPLVISNALPRAYGISLPGRVLEYDGDVPGPNGENGFYVQKPS
jgi:hypothetical protein